jgi:hypothetical protein
MVTTIRTRRLSLGVFLFCTVTSGLALIAWGGFLFAMLFIEPPSWGVFLRQIFLGVVTISFGFLLPYFALRSIGMRVQVYEGGIGLRQWGHWKWLRWQDVVVLYYRSSQLRGRVLTLVAGDDRRLALNDFLAEFRALRDLVQQRTGLELHQEPHKGFIGWLETRRRRWF